jgi:hypothetical protein
VLVVLIGDLIVVSSVRVDGVITTRNNVLVDIVILASSSRDALPDPTRLLGVRGWGSEGRKSIIRSKSGASTLFLGPCFYVLICSAYAREIAMITRVQSHKYRPTRPIDPQLHIPGAELLA